jgi:hypothetical protein
MGITWILWLAIPSILFSGLGYLLIGWSGALLGLCYILGWLLSKGFATHGASRHGQEQ